MSNTIKVSLGIAAVVVSVVLFGMVSEVYADPGTCRISDVVGSISGSSATVRNVSDRPCTVGLAVFKFTSFQDQELFRVDQRDLNPGKTAGLGVDLPECDYQIDLFAGNFPGSHNFSADHLIAAEVVTNRCPAPTPPPTPAPTPTPTPTITLLVTPGTIVCAPNTPTQTVLSWASVSGASSYTVKVRVGASGTFGVLASGLTTTTLSTPAVAGSRTYVVAAVNAQGNEFVTSNQASVTIATPSCPTPSPTPNPTTLSCSPSLQFVGSGGIATLRANGGTGIYFWNAPGGDPSQGFYQDFSTRYTSSVNSINQVTVTSGGEVATCTVRVQAGTTPTPTATPTPGVMSIQKTGRNITQGQTTETTNVVVRSNDTVEFLIRVRSLSSSTLNNVIVQDALPQGVNYIPNTTSVNNVVVQDGLTGSGINIGSLTPGQEAVIRFSALIAPGTTFPNGTLTAINTAYGRADNIPTIQSQASLSRSSIGTVAGVQTGPGETLLLTLLLSGILTYAYMLYTGTSLFNRRDAMATVRRFMGDRDRMNFMRFLR